MREKQSIKPLISFSEWIRKQYQIIIISAVVLGLSLGIWTTKPGIFLSGGSYLLTFLMIFFISLTITPQQFRLVRYQPLAVLAGLLLNFVFMPLLCWGLARLFVSDSQLATGVILVGVVPCAGMAAVWTALLKGNVPLGMAINALTMVFAPFLIPPLMFILAGSDVHIVPLKMFQQLTLILIVPLALGILIRWLFGQKWQKKGYLPLFPASSAIVAALLMFAVCNVNATLIYSNWNETPRLLASLALIFPLGFLIPFWLGRKTDWGTRIAVTYASGMKNLPIAVGLALTSLPKLAGLPVALAMVLQMLTASLFYRYLNSQKSLRGVSNEKLP